MKLHIASDALVDVYLQDDPRGESKDYLPYMLVGYRKDTFHTSWYAGLHKNTSRLVAEYRDKVEAFLAAKEPYNG
jgi:hypothetical protein